MTDKQEDKPTGEPAIAPDGELELTPVEAKAATEPTAEEPDAKAEPAPVQTETDAEPVREVPETEAEAMSEEPEPVAEPISEEPEAGSKERGKLFDAAQKDVESARHHMKHDARAIAREHLEQALSVWTEINDPSGIANATFELGILSSLQADYRLAQQHYHKALAIWEELDDRVKQTQVLIQLGHVCYCLGDNAQAQAYYTKAHERSASTDKPV